jgi:hypothetical protein
MVGVDSFFASSLVMTDRLSVVDKSVLDQHSFNQADLHWNSASHFLSVSSSGNPIYSVGLPSAAVKCCLGMYLITSFAGAVVSCHWSALHVLRRVIKDIERTVNLQ